MVEVKLNITDSILFCRNVVDIEVDDVFETDLEKIEDEIITFYNPLLINTFLSIDHLKAIAWFTGNGYQFIEIRIHAVKEIDDHFSTKDLFPYEFYRVNEPEELLVACAQMSFDDRYSCDPEIDPLLALKRNIFFLRQSFERDQEPIFILNNRHHPGILGFRSFKVESRVEASMLLSGVINHLHSEKYRSMINLFELEQLAVMDIRFINAVISARNYSEINHYISQFKYSIDKVQFVCRKHL
jgi:hypothetical protein